MDRVREVLTGHYRATRNGLPGNDDSGAMSSGYVFAAMGFFPVAGQDVYLLASPIFPQVTVRLGNGKQIVIRANHLSETNVYVQSARLNGRRWDQGWFRHGDVADGAELVLEMGPTPSAWGTNAPPPPSASSLRD